MGNYTISNERLTATISTLGAELISLKQNETDREYIWCGDADVWKRHSPVLFPLVGRLNEDKYIFEGKEYKMSQHGFARDMEFELKSQETDEIWFKLCSNTKTLENFPFSFELECGYRLSHHKLEVLWKVINCNDREMFFSIGAHPAFICPFDKNSMDEEEILFALDETNALTENGGQAVDFVQYGLLNQNGLLLKEQYQLFLNHNRGVMIKKEMFDKDALVFEEKGNKQISLCHEGRTYITVEFDAPVYGIWSPPGKGIPFVCIEPWYGRCDAEDFSGTLEERVWGNAIKANEIFVKSYNIIIEQ